MNIIILYGPPAVGKLSVARELAKITGYKIFHSHLANDLVAKYIDFDHKEFWNYVGSIKKTIYELAVKEEISIITTMCYIPEDYKEMKRLLTFFKQKGVKPYFVRLTCTKETLYKRVKQESRKEFRKLNKKGKLQEAMKKWDFFARIPSIESFELDNTKISATKAAKMIKEHYKL